VKRYGLVAENYTCKSRQHGYVKQAQACVIIKQHTHMQGRSQTFSFGGATGGASFATRVAVNGLCRTSMQWHDVTRKILGGPLG